MNTLIDECQSYHNRIADALAGVDAVSYMQTALQNVFDERERHRAYDDGIFELELTPVVDAGYIIRRPGNLLQVI